jgi:hypothetical protein
MASRLREAFILKIGAVVQELPAERDQDQSACDEEISGGRFDPVEPA